MHIRRLAAALVIAGALGGEQCSVLAQTPQTHVTMNGTILRVDSAGHQLVFGGDDKRTYTLDISHVQQTSLAGRPVTLTPGARAYVSGTGNLGGTLVVSRLQLLPPDSSRLTSVTSSTAAPEPLDLTVRGTVESVSYEQGAFVLRINTHTRLVYVTADTDISGVGGSAALGSRFPVSPGQRVTVGGSLQPNGTLLAGLLTLKGDPDYHAGPDQPNRVLVGPVSAPPNKLRSRDFKIKTADGTEVQIRVPRGIPTRRLGRPISVFDLGHRDTVRLTGRQSGTDFRAARIDVLAPPETGAEDAPPPARPGL